MWSSSVYLCHYGIALTSIWSLDQTAHCNSYSTATSSLMLLELTCTLDSTHHLGKARICKQTNLSTIWPGSGCAPLSTYVYNYCLCYFVVLAILFSPLPYPHWSFWTSFFLWSHVTEDIHTPVLLCVFLIIHYWWWFKSNVMQYAIRDVVSRLKKPHTDCKGLTVWYTKEQSLKT